MSEPVAPGGNTALADASAGAPQTAVSALLQRLRNSAWQGLAFLVALCTGLGLLLGVQAGRLGEQMVYSFAIGTSCMLAVDATRLAMAWLADRLRAARGLPPGFDRAAIGWLGLVPAMLVALAVGPSLGLSVGDLLTGERSPSVLQLGNPGMRVTLVLTLLGTAITVFAFSALERLSSARAQAEAAQRLAAENQLRLLQSQLEPHMLFNTLANLRVLIGLDPPRAQAMLDHLIGFLRRTLSASRADAHPLSAEFAHLADYLALMAVRMGPRLQTQLDLPAALAALPLPPLLLQPLVENAIKHGLEPKVAGGRIHVSARRVAGGLELTVRDTGVGLGLGQVPAAADGEATSFGLQQVRTRLATLYGTRAALHLHAADDADGGTVARLTLPDPAGAPTTALTATAPTVAMNLPATGAPAAVPTRTLP